MNQAKIKELSDRLSDAIYESSTRTATDFASNIARHKEQERLLSKALAIIKEYEEYIKEELPLF